METYNWYQMLIKPDWAPPSSIFGPVWTVLYIIIAITFGTIFYKVFTKKLPFIIALPFLLNLVFNFAFTPLQFGIKSNILASIDILFVLGTLIWAFISIWTFSKNSLTANSPNLLWIIYANIPYLLWVSFATILQLTITYLNW